MKQVVVTGGTGLLGKRICKLLVEQDYEPLLLTRKINPALPYKQFLWNPILQNIDERVFEDCYAIIHLAGAGVANQRWTNKYKQEIISSRVLSAKLLYNTLQKLGRKVQAFISSSAVGIYPANTHTLLTESSSPSNSFLGQTCLQWEQSADQFSTHAERIVKLRIGIVLSREGGALKEIYRTMPFGISGIFGNGKQIYPWIHIEDVARMFLFALQQSLHGTYNAAAPEKAAYLDIIAAIEKSTHHKTLHLPAPQFALNLALGEFANTLYASQHVSAQKIMDKGFEFQYPTLQKAINSLFTA